MLMSKPLSVQLKECGGKNNLYESGIICNFIVCCFGGLDSSTVIPIYLIVKEQFGHFEKYLLFCIQLYTKVIQVWNDIK